MDCGVDVNAVDNYGNVPLHDAAWQGHLQVVEVCPALSDLFPNEQTGRSFFLKEQPSMPMRSMARRYFKGRLMVGTSISCR